MEIIPKPVSGIVDKIEAHADKLGFAVGGYMELARFGREWPAGQNAIDTAIYIAEGIIKDPHLPNLSHVTQSLFWETGTFRPAAMAAILGWLLKECGAGIIPHAGKGGSAIMKAGIGAAGAAVILNFLMQSGVGHSPVGGASTMSTASMTPQASFNVGGPGKPHASSTNGYKNTLTYESVVAA